MKEPEPLPAFDSSEWFYGKWPEVSKTPEWNLALKAANRLMVSCHSGEMKEPHVARKVPLVGPDLIAHLLYPYIRAASDP